MSATQESVSKGNGAAQVDIVTMRDGRKIEFVGKRKMLKTSISTSEGGPAIRLDFRNGETRTYPLSSNLLERYALHGAEQKYGDETAGLDDIDDMILATDDLHSRLIKDEWTVKREGGGMSGTSVLLRAMVEYSGKTTEDIKTFLRGLSQTDKLGLRNDEKVRPGKPNTIKAIVQRLESEKASKATKVDTDALLASMPA